MITTTTPLAEQGTRDNWRQQPVPADVLLAVCVMGIAVLVGLVANNEDVGDVPPANWGEWLLTLIPGFALIFRSTARRGATALAVVAQMVIWILGVASAFFAALVMIYTLTSEGNRQDRKLAVLACVALAGLSFIGVFAAKDVHIDLCALTIMFCAVAYLMGVNAAQLRVKATTLASDLAVTQVEQENERNRAALDERSRIARELHDIVGHSLSVIAVRAEAADRVAESNPDAAVDAVGDIAGAARSSLVEVRRVLSGMRNEEPGVELAPVPSLATIPELLNSTALAGVETLVMVPLPADEAVGATVGAGVYRIVQEALTNVVKHGGPKASAELTIQLRGTDVLVRVDDNGRGVPAADTDEVTGSGLAGMRERAEVLGGSFTSGPRPGGGFRVEALLPAVTAGSLS